MLTRRRLFISVGIMIALFMAIAAMTAGKPPEAKATAQVAAVASPTPSSSTSLPSPPQQCEERTAYSWKIVAPTNAKPVERLLTKGKQAVFNQSVTITRSIASVTLWCGPEGGELTQCGANGLADCPDSVTTARRVAVDETATLIRKTTCTSSKGFTCSSVPSAPQQLTAESTVVTHSVTVKNESSACRADASFTTLFQVRTPDDTAEITWTSPKMTAASGPCPKPKPVVKPKPKPVAKPKPAVTWVKMTADYWRSNPGLLGRYLTVCLGIEPGHQDNEPTCIGSTSYAQSVLSADSSGDGLARLSAQLLAAKLNLKSGGPSGASCLDEADRLLDWYKGAEWQLLSAYNKSYVNSCASQLAAYNGSVVRRG